jgi:hypothetical protein
MLAVFQVDEMSLESAASGAIWGAVWWDIAGPGFPEAEWNDLAVAFAVENLAAVREVATGARSRRVRFFDGPFWVEFSRDQQGMRFSITTSDGHRVECDKPEFASIVSQVETASQKLVAECAERGWGEQADVQHLRALLAATPT